jgi:hypothetical protein
MSTLHSDEILSFMRAAFCNHRERNHALGCETGLVRDEAGLDVVVGLCVQSLALARLPSVLFTDNNARFIFSSRLHLPPTRQTTRYCTGRIFCIHL